jgi:hypothetical protein
MEEVACHHPLRLGNSPRGLLRQPEDERGGSLGDRRSTGSAVREGPAFGDEGSMPAQQSCGLEEEPLEMLAGEQPCESQRPAVGLATEDRHFVSDHDDLDNEVSVAAADKSDQPETRQNAR